MASSREQERENILTLGIAPEIPNGDELHNINCFDYLTQIKNAIDRAIAELCESNPDLDKDTLIQYWRTNKDRRPLKLISSITSLYFNENLITYTLNEKNEPVAYGELYTQTLQELESNIEQIKQCKAGLATDTHPNSKVFFAIINAVIDSIYLNPNQALERTTNMIASTLEQSHHTSTAENNVRKRMLGILDMDESAIQHLGKYIGYFIGSNRNPTTPQQEGSATGRLQGMYGQFKPQFTTSLPSIRRYQYIQEYYTPRSELGGKSYHELLGRKYYFPIELRFGTQAQFYYQDIVQNPFSPSVRVNPLFETWLDRQYEKHLAVIDEGRLPNDQKQIRHITHIYYNYLGYDRSGYEGNREKAFSLSLHEAEKRHPNLAVITLPADKGLFDAHLINKHEKSISKSDAFNLMFGIATNKSIKHIQIPGINLSIKDFEISPNIKKLLYGGDTTYDELTENSTITRLLNFSFNEMGFSSDSQLSPAELQAVYSHFINYALPSFINARLEPQTVDHSCKDAIDRGAKAAAFFNVLSAINILNDLAKINIHPDPETFFSKDDFDSAVHAAAALVKGRAMNHHVKLLWNTVNQYIIANQKHVIIPNWLNEWRIKNKPLSVPVFDPIATINHLINYHNSILFDSENFLVNLKGFFSITGYMPATKLSAAEKLLKMIARAAPDALDIANKSSDLDSSFDAKYDFENNIEPLTKDELGALKQGRLGKTYKRLIQDGFIKEHDGYPIALQIKLPSEVMHSVNASPQTPITDEDESSLGESPRTSEIYAAQSDTPPSHPTLLDEDSSDGDDDNQLSSTYTQSQLTLSAQDLHEQQLKVINSPQDLAHALIDPSLSSSDDTLTANSTKRLSTQHILQEGKATPISIEDDQITQPIKNRALNPFLAAFFVTYPPTGFDPYKFRGANVFTSFTGLTDDEYDSLTKDASLYAYAFFGLPYHPNKSFWKNISDWDDVGGTGMNIVRAFTTAPARLLIAVLKLPVNLLLKPITEFLPNVLFEVLHRSANAAHKKMDDAKGLTWLGWSTLTISLDVLSMIPAAVGFVGRAITSPFENLRYGLKLGRTIGGNNWFGNTLGGLFIVSSLIITGAAIAASVGIAAKVYGTQIGPYIPEIVKVIAPAMTFIGTKIMGALGIAAVTAPAQLLGLTAVTFGVGAVISPAWKGLKKLGSMFSDWLGLTKTVDTKAAGAVVNAVTPQVPASPIMSASNSNLTMQAPSTYGDLLLPSLSSSPIRTPPATPEPSSLALTPGSDSSSSESRSPSPVAHANDHDPHPAPSNPNTSSTRPRSKSH